MYFLKCNKCGYFNEVKTEYLVFCSKCNKKLDNCYSNWVAKNPNGTFQDFTSTVCVSSVPETPQATQISPGKRWIQLAMLGATLTIAGLIAGSTIIGMLRQTNSTKTLNRESEQLNRNCPAMIDQDTRLDNTMVMVNNTFQLNLTLINVDKQTANTNEIRQYIEPSIVEYVRTNTDLSVLRENRTAICFFYRDKNGNYLFSITVKPEQYE